MLKLNTFEPSSEQISLSGDLQLLKKNILIDFTMNAPQSLIDYASKGIKKNPSTNRMDELWKHTCFEAFWAKPSSPDYWEFNVAANGMWNIYHFNSYRSPNPPQESFDFELIKFEFSPTKLSALLSCNIVITSLEAALTSIIKTNLNQTLYFATCHSGSKPDFHIRESFQLKRSQPL
jgi:hypothetical protein